MRTRTQLCLILVLTLGLLAALSGAAAQGIQADPRGDPSTATHLVLSVGDGGEARINRMDWDVNAFAPAPAGTTVRASDYLDLSGRTTLQILCTDLALIEQRGSEAPQCNAYPSLTAFWYPADPVWSMVGARPTITVYPANLASTPEGINPAEYTVRELGGGDLDAVTAAVNTITGLPVAPEAQVFALASFYRGQGMIFEALTAFSTLPDVQCSARRPSVDAGSVANALAASPVTYLRIGELYDILGKPDDALRNYGCAASLAEASGDQANAGLAYARQANLQPDPVQAITLYQRAIDQYAALGARANAEALLAICGQRNCTLP